MEAALLETWLSDYENAPYNLGESSVENHSFDELLTLTSTHASIGQVSLDNNPTHGSLLFRQAIADQYENVNVDDILVTAGTTEAIFLYFQSRYQAKANVVVPVPTFHVLHEVPELMGYEVRKLALKREDDFHLDLEALTELVDENTRAIILNTPHNPTGVVYTDEEIQVVIDLAEKYNVDILADEHYRFLPHDQTDLLPSMYGRSPRVVALGSIGKCFGCIGLRVGWIIATPEIIKGCHLFKDYTTHTISPIIDFLSAHVLLNKDKFLPRYQDYIKANLLQFEDFMEKQQGRVNWVKPDAGTIAYPYFSEESMDSLAFSKQLVEQQGVLLLPGEAFDTPKHFRIALGVNPEFFQQALERFAQELKNT